MPRARQPGLVDDGDIALISGGLTARDHADRHNTLRADDAVEIDTAGAGVDEIVDHIVGLLPEHAPRT